MSIEHAPRGKHHCRWADTKKASDYSGLSESWFNNSRVAGGGIPFIKVGSKVLYDLNEVDNWLNARRRRSTSEVQDQFVADRQVSSTSEAPHTS